MAAVLQLPKSWDGDGILDILSIRSETVTVQPFSRRAVLGISLQSLNGSVRLGQAKGCAKESPTEAQIGVQVEDLRRRGQECTVYAITASPILSMANVLCER